MRFDSGLLAHVGDIARYPEVDEWAELPRFIEQLGFTGVWSAEHHFAWDTGITPTPTNPLLYGAYVAQSTKNLRIGQCAVNLSAHHPLRVAEDAAMLDHMTGGRMDFGFMKGLNGKVSHQFDPNTAVVRDHDKTNGELIWEAYEVIKRFWSGEPFRFDGKYFSFPYPWDGAKIPVEFRDPKFYSPDGKLIALRGMPRPMQSPIPPAYIMSDSVGSTMEAARNGVCAVGWAQTYEGTRERTSAYWDAARKAVAAGTMPAGAHLRTAMMRPTFVAPTAEEAEAVMRPAINGLFGKVFGLDDWLGKKPMLASHEELTEADIAMDWYDFFISRKQCFIGSPEQVVDQLKAYEEDLGVEHLIMYWALPQITFEQQKGSLRLFSEKVMPHFSSSEPKTVPLIHAAA